MEFNMKLCKLPSRSKTSRTPYTHSTSKKMKKSTGSKCRKCVCVPHKIGPVEFPPVWTELRKKGQLCDGMVCCQDGTEFKIHRAILSVVSPYFKALFTNSINRGQPEATSASVNIPGDIFQTLMDFAYTGTCYITTENVEALLQYADQYEVLGVVQLCCQYILEQLQPSNCLGIFRFGRHYCKDLEKKGRQYVRQHFEQVVQDSKELIDLTPDDLRDILSDDELNVRNEEYVFRAIRKWMCADIPGRRMYLLGLLKCMRLGTMSKTDIENLENWSLVAESQECKELLNSVKNAVDSMAQEGGDTPEVTFMKPRIPYDILFAIGGWSAGSPTNFVETYDIRADCWLLSTDTDPVPRAYHGLCALNGLIYMIGGFDGNEHFNTVRCFNPVTHVWRECACMYYPRCYVSVVMHEGKIYAMGGYNGRQRMRSVERYDPEENQWQLISPMLRQRSDASAASLEDKIYIVGGFNGQDVMKSAEVYDPVTNQWTLIPHMTSARSGVSLVAYKNTLYAIGGFNGYTRLTTGEKFSPGRSIGWDEISAMVTPRSNFATVILDDLIYVIGGFNAGSTTIGYVECYDPESNQWFDTSPMNLNRSALSACVISGLPNAREYSMVGRSHKQVGQGAGMHEDGETQ